MLNLTRIRDAPVAPGILAERELAAISRDFPAIASTGIHFLSELTCGPVFAGPISIPGLDTWDAFTPRPIRGLRKSIIINYVGPEWRAGVELC